MDFAQVLLVLWRRRGWVLLGALLALVIGLSTGYRISFAPPSLKPKSLAQGSASTELLVDSPRSAIGDLSKDITLLETRAAVLAPFMTTEPVRRAIAQQVGLPVQAIYTSAPLNPDGTLFSNEPSAAQRSQALLGQRSPYRLNFAANAYQPTITVTATAPTAQDAVRLADGAATAFVSYMAHIEQIQGIPFTNRTVIRQLGAANGGTIGRSVKFELVILAFVGALIGWMVLVVIISSLADNLRQLRASGPQTPGHTPELS